MSVKKTVGVFKRIGESGGGNYNRDLFESAIGTLKENSLSGLDNEDLKPLMVFLLTDRLKTANHFTMLLSCLVPKGTISSDVVDKALTWLLSVYHDVKVTPSKIKGMLQWIIGLMEFNLVDKEIIDGYFDLYHGLLCFESFQQLGCKLLYMLTRPEDVNPCRIKVMLQHHAKNGMAKHTGALLGLYKSYKPELVPGAFSMQNVHRAFKQIPSEMKVCFENAQERLLDQSNRQKQQEERLTWLSLPADKNGRGGVPLIPTAMYTHLGSEAYREKHRKVIDFLSKNQLACHQLSIEVPTSILSFILNEGGIHLLTTSNSDVQSRFSYVLYYVLRSAFCLNGNPPRTTYRECERLLEQLVVLEEYMQQGIPVISRFLGEYIGSWNGLDHRCHIYRLLERVTFMSFEEFDHCILGHLQTLFLSGNTSEKCTIINTLSNLICNLFVASGFLRSNGSHSRQHFFLGEYWHWETDIQSVLPTLIQVVSDFCSQGLMIANCDPLILHTSLSFYEMLVNLEEKTGPLTTVLPPAVMYACIFSPDLSMLSRASGLLLRYQKLSADVGIVSAESIRTESLLNAYSCDIYNLLINKKAFTKSAQGYIFCQAKDVEKKVLQGDSAFGLESDLTVLGISLQMLKLNFVNKIPIDKNELPIALTLSFGDLNQLIDILRKKYAQYHRGKSYPTEQVM